MKIPKLLLAVLAATLVVPTFAQGGGGYLDLSKDAFVTGGLTDGGIAKELLPAFAGYAPTQKADEVISFAFNYDVPKLQLAFRDAKGKIQTRTGKLAKGEKLVATVNTKTRQGGVWMVDATVRWAHHCGNPLPTPFKVTLWVPDWSQDRLVIQRIEVPAPYAVTVRENVIVQQIVPTIGDVNISVPAPTEQPRHRLVVLGREEAGRRWEYRKDFWDGVLDFLRVASFPIGQLVRRADNISINTSSQGGAGGNGYGAAAAAAASSSSSSSTSATPTSAAGTSGSGGSSAGGAAGGGGNDTTGSGSGGMPEMILLFDRPWLQVAA